MFTIKNKLLISGLSLVLLSCSITKETTATMLQNEIPFKVLNASYSNLKDSQPTSKGFAISVEIDNLSMQLDSVYFRNMKGKLAKDMKSKTPQFQANLKFLNFKKDYNLDINPKKEYGNQAPDVSQKTPFNLQKNECVISFLYQGKTQYFKIENLIEIKN